MKKENYEKYTKDFQIFYQDIKEMKENVEGSMSHIQAREILWNDIIDIVENIWEFLVIMEEEKIIVRDMEGEITAPKQKLQ